MSKTYSNKKYEEFNTEAVPHMDILYNYALHMTGNSDDAHDLVQETYMKAFRFWDKYEKGTNIRAWLFRIMKNSYINRYRKETKEPETVDYEDISNFYNSIRDHQTDKNDLQEKIFGGLLDDDVARAIETLPEDFRTVIILADIEGMSYDEIAEFIDCPVGTVRSRLHRARKMLKVKLYDYAKKIGYVTEENQKS
jgi:RNA polymerase sigma-70 factor (ECF subfamily)